MLLDPKVELAGLALIGEEKLAGESLLGLGPVDKLAVSCYTDGWMKGQVGEVSTLSNQSIRVYRCISQFNTYVSSNLS